MNKTLEEVIEHVLGETAYSQHCSDMIEVIPKSEVLKLMRLIRGYTLNECARMVAKDYTTDHSYTIRNLNLNTIEL